MWKDDVTWFNFVLFFKPKMWSFFTRKTEKMHIEKNASTKRQKTLTDGQKMEKHPFNTVLLRTSFLMRELHAEAIFIDFVFLNFDCKHCL